MRYHLPACPRSRSSPIASITWGLPRLSNCYTKKYLFDACAQGQVVDEANVNRMLLEFDQPERPAACR